MKKASASSKQLTQIINLLAIFQQILTLWLNLSTFISCCRTVAQVCACETGPQNYISQAVIKRNKGGDKWEGREREKMLRLEKHLIFYHLSQASLK